jgi:RHS repeat-associated protein
LLFGVGTGNSQRLATRVDGTLYYVHSDLLGSTVALSDAAGQAVGRVQYDPYGEVLTGTLPVTLTDRLFTGARFDGTIGLYQMGARWYDPALGRWIQADSIVPEPGNPQALNRYTYVYNNPLRYADPSGHGPPDWLERVVKAIREWWESDELRIRWAEIISTLKRGNEVRSPSLWDPSMYREMYRTRVFMSDPEGMRKAEQAATIIELGFGFVSNLAALKRRNRDARVVGIEHPKWEHAIKYSTSCQEAIEQGAEVMFVDYRNLPKDLTGAADEVIAIAPQPLGLFGMASKYETAEVMSDLVKPGGTYTLQPLRKPQPAIWLRCSANGSGSKLILCPCRTPRFHTLRTIYATQHGSLISSHRIRR